MLEQLQGARVGEAEKIWGTVAGDEVGSSQGPHHAVPGKTVVLGNGISTQKQQKSRQTKVNLEKTLSQVI